MHKLKNYRNNMNIELVGTQSKDMNRHLDTRNSLSVFLSHFLFKTCHKIKFPFSDF